MDPRRIARDVRALGPTAPLRAAYEASKKLGGHRVAFSGLARRDAPRSAIQSGLRLAGDVPDSARERAVQMAEEIVSGHVTLFSRSVPLAFPSASHLAIEREGQWPALPWWTIDIRSETRLADVKWTWELGRGRHLAVLARAAASDERFIPQADTLLRSWALENPPEQGIHWYSNLEIALRSIALTEVVTRVGERMSTDAIELTRVQLWHAGRHLVADLPYTLSTMRNNHLLGDALGLQVIGADFATRRSGRWWGQLGDRLFHQQAARHFHPDGSMIEDSLSYHRFVLEMLVIQSLVAGHSHPHPALVPSAQLLARLGALEGPVPQYGDWDEGRVLFSTQDPSDMAGSVRAALALGGSGSDPSWREAHDECAWYVPPGEPVAPDVAEQHGRDVGGGMARAQRGCFTVWLKVGSAPSHGHADLCSTPLLVDGHWVVGDPGTGTYNGPIEQRTYFRSSIAHSVLRLDGYDQLEPHRAFRWAHDAHGLVGAPIRVGDAVVLWGAHDAYRRLDPARRVARTVVLTTNQATVADWVEGPAGARFNLSLPLGPGVHFDQPASTVTLPTGRQLMMRLPGVPTAVTGQQSPFDGWWSPTYGRIEPATRLEVTGRLEGPVCWSLATEPSSPVRAEPELLLTAGLSLRIEWGTRVTWLHVEPLDGRPSSQALLRWRP